jgi:hypothetical protein
MASTLSSSSARGGRQTIGVDDLEVGMILMEDVHDQQGRLLIPSGTALTDRHLRAFQMWGILSVKVGGTGEDEPPELVISPEILAEAETRVRERLRQNDLESPVILEILRFAVQREARLIAAGERSHA